MKKFLLTLGVLFASIFSANAQVVEIAREEATGNWGVLSGSGGLDITWEVSSNAKGESYFLQASSTAPDYPWYAFGLKGERINCSGLSDGPNGNPDLILNKLDKDGNLLYTLYSDRGYFDQNSPLIATADGGALLVLKMRLIDSGREIDPGKKIMLRLHHSKYPDYEYVIDETNLPEDLGWINKGYILKLDAEGLVEWKREVYTDWTKVDDNLCSNMFDFKDAVEGPDGNYYILGHYARPLTIEGASKQFVPDNVTEGWDYDYVQNAQGDLFLTVFSPEGKYLWTLTHAKGSIMVNEGAISLATDREAVYAMGHLKSYAGKESPLTFGDKTITMPADTKYKDLFLMKINCADNATSNDDNVKVDFLRNYPGTTTAIKPMGITVADGKIVVYGSIQKGGITDNGNVIVEDKGKQYHGFVFTVSNVDGSVKAGTLAYFENNKICEVDAAFVAEKSIYALGYTFGIGGWIASFDKETLEAKTLYGLFTGGAAPTVYNASMIGNNLTMFGRGRWFPFVIKGVPDEDLFMVKDQQSPDYKNWEVLVANFTMEESVFIDPAPSGVEDVVEESALKVYGAQGNVVVETENPCQVNVYNVAGALVRSLQVESGRTEIALPQGFYIVNGQKVIVK